jgi:hypothetical protein
VRSSVLSLVQAVGTCALVATAAHQAAAQSVSYSSPHDVPPATIIEIDDNRSGPRIGAAYLIGGSVTAEREGVHIQPLMSLFGWQVEHPFPTGVAGAPLPIVETIFMVGGLEQSRPLGSATLILGARQPNGWEVGVGPTLTGAGTQLTFAAGVTRSLGRLNFPLNLAVTPGRRGASISLTTGFTRHTGY